MGAGKHPAPVSSSVVSAASCPANLSFSPLVDVSACEVLEVRLRDSERSEKARARHLLHRGEK